MLELPASVRELAEDTPAYAPLRAGDRRTVMPGYALCLGLTPGPHSTVVTRLRLREGEVAATVRELRAQLRGEGRTIASWEVGPSATPGSLAAELAALDMQPAAPPFTVTAGMVLARTPPRIGVVPEGLRITRVSTLADFRRAQEIYWHCFEFIPDAAAQAGLEVDYERMRQSRTWLRYLAWRDGRAVAAADATLTADGVILFGGATLPEARGSGVYQALVWERWLEAVRQGTPYLITQAGSLSRPILARMGFVVTAEVQNFVDRLD